MQQEPDRWRESVERSIERVRQSDLPADNVKAILDFADVCYNEGLSSKRVLKYLGILPKFSKMLQKPFADAKHEDIERVIGQIERSDYSEWTKHDYKVAMKKFYRWLRKMEYEYPHEVRWIRSTIRKTRTKLPEHLLTQQEVQAMIIAATTVRDKTFISSLYESGCRISELLYLRMRQIHKHPHGFQITVVGKKGSSMTALGTAIAAYKR